MLYVCAFYTMFSLSLLCLGKFYMYISYTVVILTLHLYYIRVCVDMFVYNIRVSTFICLCMLYNLIIGCASSWSFSISLQCMGYSDTAQLLHLRIY